MSSINKRQKSLVKRTKSFFGVESDYSFDEIEAWNQRRLKFCVNKFGNLNYEKLKNNEFNQSFNVGEIDDSLVANVDYQDGNNSYQLSSINQSPYNLNNTFTSYNTKGCLSSSIMNPQTPTIGPPKKQHAFKAIANLVMESLATQKRSQDMKEVIADIPQHNILRIMSDNNNEEEEDIIDGRIDDRIEEMQFVSLTKPLSSSIIPAIIIPTTSKELKSPIRTRTNNYRCRDDRNSKLTNKRISYKWTNSMVEKVRIGRRRFTDSLVGQFVCCLPKQSNDTKILAKQIDDSQQYRPYFTYWTCLVQIIVFISSISVYGLAPIRMDFVHKELGEVVVPSASIEQVCRVEYVNLFIGLRQADLIRLGARYSPCMRKDDNLQKSIIDEQRDRDRRSGCCIRNDGGGCYQTSKSLCSSTLATWSHMKMRDQVPTSMVCGLDPDFCDNPKSMAPFLWNNDVIKWPICEMQSSIWPNMSSATGRHMKCELTGRPCCIGSKAECIITTRQHCIFLRGYYHPEAALCSQINCLNEICGMLNFYDPDRPDQIYRLFIAIFVNSSLGSLVVTLCFQLTIMRDLEKMAGWHRISIIYILSGMVGNLCSGIFLPYQVQTGASGSILALLSLTFTEFIQSWKMVQNPKPVFFKFLGLVIFLFILGFLPFFDNFANMSGLISGIILSFIFLPFLGMPNISGLQKLLATSVSPKETFEKFQQQRKQRRLIIILVGSTIWILLTTIGFIFFYWYPVTHCSFCKYFNCIPIAPYFCENMDVNITTKTDCVLKD